MNGDGLPPSGQSPFLPSGEQPKRFWVILLYPFIHMLIQVVVSFAIILVYVVVAAVDSVSILEAQDLEDYMALAQELLRDEMNLLTYAILVVSSAFSILLFWMLFLRQNSRFRGLTALRPASLKLLPLSVVLVVAANLFIGNVLYLLLDVLPEGTQVSSLENIIAHPALVFAGLVVLGPIAEELCFRMLVFRNLRNHHGFWVANGMQAALFGLIHMLPLQMAYAFLFGLLLGWIYERTGRFIFPVVGHMAFNFLGAINLLFPASEEAMASSDGEMSVLPYTIAALAMCLVCHWFFKRYTHKYTLPNS